MADGKKSDRVKARLSRGLRDLLPEQMLARQRMVETIQRVYEGYGFSPLATPAVEYLDVLTGSAGEEATGSIFRVTNPEEEELGLRFDLTVPLARVIAQHRELQRPFRRYQVGSVWRADKPDPGRFREFTQFDLDSVGTTSEVADTEIITGMCDTLDALGVEAYRVRFSSRGVLNVLLAYAEIPREQGADVFRVLDKLDKIGLDKVKRELTTGYKDSSGDVISGVGLQEAQVERIERFLALGGETREEVLDQVAELFRGIDGAEREIGLLATLSRHLKALGYPDSKAMVDLSIARGLAYYTGSVFEAHLLDAPKFGSVFGGGRYDDLVLRFSGEKVPAVGASIGVDRLLAALEHLGKVRHRRTTTQVLVLTMDPELMDDYLAMTYELRRAGVAAEIYLGKPKAIGKQLKYADRCGVPLALLVGSDEKAAGRVTLKDLEAGRERSAEVEGRQEWLEERPGQREISRGDLVPVVKALLETIEGGAR